MLMNSWSCSVAVKTCRNSQKAVKDIVQAAAQNAGSSAVKNALTPAQQPLPKEAQDEIKKA